MTKKNSVSRNASRRTAMNPDDPNARAACGRLAGWVGIGCNVVLCAFKLIVGSLSGSVAITADAFNNLSDASSSVVNLIGFKLSARPADREHPYGHGRYEYLAGLTVAVLIAAVGIELLLSSFRKVLSPEPVDFQLITGLVLVFSIGVKLWMMGFYHRMGKRIHSTALLTSAADSRNDVITTTAVLISSLIAHFLQLNLDGYIGVVVAVFILFSSVGLIKKSVDTMLGSAPDAAYVDSIRQRILDYPGVLGTHDLMIHDYGPGRQFASVHVELDAEKSVLDSHSIVDSMERDFLADGLHLTVHVDPVVTGGHGDLRAWLEDEVKKIDPQLSIHDLRTSLGPGHTDLIFDCAVPSDFSLSDSELSARIDALVRQTYPDYHCLITIDHSFAPVNH